MKRTKILATIGPACSDVDGIRALQKAGVNACRLNFSHGTHEEHREFIQRIREVIRETGEPLTIVQDLQGPKIRLGALPKEGRELCEDEEVVFTTSPRRSAKKIPVDFPELHKHLSIGHRVLLDDGLLAVEVLKVVGNDIHCRVVNGGVLYSHKGMNVPDTKLPISALTEKDKADARFGLKEGVDWMALSFVRSARDVRELRDFINRVQKEEGLPNDPSVRILVKIEKPEALKHLQEIVDEADGVMVARGDLGVEIRPEKVPVEQKRIIDLCLAQAKPVIVATQMLDSMIRNPRATRAEVSDIANAVIQHADATMLSGETASGKYPLSAVEVMSATIQETEKSAYDDVPVQVRLTKKTEEAMTNIATVLSRASQVKAIVVTSLSGDAARFVTRYRPEIPVYAVTPHERVQHQMNLLWGVRPFLVPMCKTIPELIASALDCLQSHHLLKKKDRIVIVAGEPLGQSGSVNLVELREV